MTSATVTVRGKCTGGYPLPSMLLETYDKGVKIKSKTVGVASLGSVYVDSVVVTSVGIHRAQGRMVLTNALGSYEFLTLIKEFELAVPVLPSFAFAIVEFITYEQPVYKSGTIKIDGTSYNVTGSANSLQLAAGHHTIQATIPSGYKFLYWTFGQSYVGAVVVDNEYANPTGFTISGNGSMVAWIELSYTPPPSGFTTLYTPYRGVEIWYNPTTLQVWCCPKRGYEFIGNTIQECIAHIDWVFTAFPP